MGFVVPEGVIRRGPNHERFAEMERPGLGSRSDDVRAGRSVTGPFPRGGRPEHVALNETS